MALIKLSAQEWADIVAALLGLQGVVINPDGSVDVSVTENQVVVALRPPAPSA